MKKDNVIDITKKIWGDNPPSDMTAIEILDGMHKKNADALLTFFMKYVLQDVEIGLGLVDCDDDIETQAFEHIDALYRKAAQGCYFCDKSVDPNEVKITKETKLCMMCQLKLRNFVEALGIPAGKVFKWME